MKNFVSRDRKVEKLRLAVRAEKPVLAWLKMAGRPMFSRMGICFRLILLCAIHFHRRTQAENILCPASCSCLGSLVDCSKRGLNDVPKDMPNWVRTLELQNNDFTSLKDDAFDGLVNLEKINLGNNQLRRLNATSFQHLTSLKELNLQFNFLTEIPFLGHLSSLLVLSLHHNNIDSIDSLALENLPALSILDLHHNRITTILNGTFLNGNKLRHLSLNSNRIASLDSNCLDNLTHLETLRLNRNKLSNLTKDFFRPLKRLKTLELSRNRIATIRSLTFKGLDSLEVLKLQGNRIVSLLDGAFWKLSNMKQLNLDNNSITLVSRGWLYGLTSLQQLSLKHNQLMDIEDDSWAFCENLSELDLSHNHLQILRKNAFARLTKLRSLNLEHNNISFIEDGAFKRLSSLKKLVLNNNGISWTIEDMMGAFVGLDTLQNLNLTSNLIKSIARHAFKGLEKLDELDLSNNSLTTIQNNSFDSMKSLKKLRLDSSSLLCDCQLQWLPGWLESNGLKQMVSATCAYPEWLKGKSVFDVKAEDFTCEDFPKPYFTEEPKTQIALKGDNVTLTCKAASSSSSNVTFQWKKDNNVLHHASTNNFAQASSGEITVYTTILSLLNVSDRDNGLYQCVISNDFGSAYSQKANLAVHVFPTFTKTPVDVTVKAGSKARLECAAKGQPPPRIAWQKDGGDDFPAARERRMHVMPSDEVFFIVNVRASDMGTYSCTANNVAGGIMANFTLTVLELPSFIKKMEDKETRVGKTTVLECMASGSPKPKLMWSKDGSPLEENERHFFTTDGELLVIVETRPSDAGSYMCEISNPLGTERGISYVTVVPAHPSDENMTGIIIIAVVCCVVGTSLVWVVIIYKTRKRHEEFLPSTANESLPGELVGYPQCLTSCPEEFKGCTQQLFSDDNSEHSSKDSGTGDSAKRSSENLIPSDLDGPGKPLLMPVGHRVAVIAAGDSLNSLKGHNSNSSVDTLSSSPSTQTTSSGGDGGRPRGLSDPTFRTFQPRPTNHDRMLNERLITPATAVFYTVTPKTSRSTTSADVNQWIPTSCSGSSSLWHEPIHKGLYSCSSDDRHSEGYITTPSSSTFPRSASSLSHKRNAVSVQLTRPHQEVQNDSGSFSIVSEDLQPSGGSNIGVCHSVSLGSAVHHGKCSLPNLTYLERTTPFYKSKFDKKESSQAPCKV